MTLENVTLVIMNRKCLPEECAHIVYIRLCTHITEAPYLVEGKSADAVSGQLHRVQHGDLDHPIGLRST